MFWAGLSQGFRVKPIADFCRIRSGLNGDGFVSDRTLGIGGFDSYWITLMKFWVMGRAEHPDTGSWPLILSLAPLISGLRGARIKMYYLCQIHSLPRFFLYGFSQFRHKYIILCQSQGFYRYGHFQSA